MYEGTTGQDWPEELDALRAAPKHHALLFENEAVRVLDTSVGPGETVPLHTHRWPSVLYILSWSDFVRRDAAGVLMADSHVIGGLPEGSARWAAPLTAHTLENVGTQELRAISVEMKNGV